MKFLKQIVHRINTFFQRYAALGILDLSGQGKSHAGEYLEEHNK